MTDIDFIKCSRCEKMKLAVEFSYHDRHSNSPMCTACKRSASALKKLSKPKPRKIASKEEKEDVEDFT